MTFDIILLLSSIFYLLSSIFYLLSSIFYLLSSIFYLLYLVYNHKLSIHLSKNQFNCISIRVSINIHIIHNNVCICSICDYTYIIYHIYVYIYIYLSIYLSFLSIRLSVYLPIYLVSTPINAHIAYFQKNQGQSPFKGVYQHIYTLCYKQKTFFFLLFFI